jgi:chaperonin GroES
MKIQPLASRVLVKPFPADEISEGGIIVPENARGRSNKATVVAIGEATKYKVGDIVFHVKEAGTEIHEDGVAYWLISDVDILCTLEDGEELIYERVGAVRIIAGRDKNITFHRQEN